MKDQEDKKFVFSKENYKFMLIGIAVVLVGFILMIGGGTDDPNKFNGDALFSFRRITLAPLLVLAGYGLVAYSIMKKKKGE